MSITIYEGSILDVKADVIVNPANGHLRHTGGLARVIAKAATAYPKGFLPPASPDAREELFDERDGYLRDRAAWQREQDEHPLIATGNVGWTSAGVLPFEEILHVVGPIWNGGAFLEHDLLELAYHNALIAVAERGYDSVVFPAISCGIFGFPAVRSAGTAMDVLSMWDFRKLDITVALTDAEHVEAYAGVNA